MDITAALTKTVPERCVVDEFVRVLIVERQESPEAIRWAFRRWREESGFFPTPFDILTRLKIWHREQRAAQEELERQQARENKRMGLEQLRDILAPFVQKKPRYEPLSEEELKRRKEEQLKAVEEKFGDKKNAPGNDPRSNS